MSSAYGGIVRPKDLLLLQAVFDRVHASHEATADQVVRDRIASRLMSLFQAGEHDGDALFAQIMGDPAFSDEASAKAA